MLTISKPYNVGGRITDEYGEVGGIKIWGGGDRSICHFLDHKSHMT
jgi:hypothetical protein